MVACGEPPMAPVERARGLACRDAPVVGVAGHHKRAEDEARCRRNADTHRCNGGQRHRTCDGTLRTMHSLSTRPKFLVADDMPAIARLISELLREAGADVVGLAHNGAQALRL